MLKEEQDACQQELQLMLNKQSNGEGKEEEQIRLNLEVQELSYLLHVQEEVGMIRFGCVKKAFRALARLLRSSDGETISADNMSNQYYSVKRNVKLSVRDRLVEMLNYVRRDLG